MADYNFGLHLVVEDHSAEALAALAGALEQGLTACGAQAERTAKQKCPVGDPTKWHPPRPKGSYIGGTLRNSITFALDGESAHETQYKVENKSGAPGTYSGTAPKEGLHSRAVYVGTNVHYAPYVEMGTSKMAARPFIEPAFRENIDNFKMLLMNALKGTGSYVE